MRDGIRMTDTQEQARIAVLGTGVMGETVLTGILAAGWDPERVVATARRAERADELTRTHGVRTTHDNVAAASEADIVILGVKPKDIGALTEEISSAIRPGTLVLTVAVGLSCAFYEKRLPEGTPFVRVMPNTPSSIGAGVSAISPGVAATDEHLDLVETILASTGLVIRIAEKDQAAVAALSGSGPAYVFYVLDALSEAGTLMGIPRATAAKLAAQTVFGAAKMVQETGEHPAILREKVSSPGGTTIAGVRELDRGGVRAAFVEALTAAKTRAGELSAELEAE